MIPLVKSYLGEPAFVWKRGAKPRSSTSGERSQGDSEMSRREVAGSLYLVGLLLGLARGRASEVCAKPDGSVPILGHPVATCAVGRQRAGMVLRAITSGQGHLHFTGEVPPRPGLSGPATRSYKAKPKCSGDARVAGTGSYRPRLEGCQQSHSRSRRLPSVGTERQNHREQSGGLRFMGKVSGASKATTWPAGTSFRQLAPTLRNVLQQPRHRRAAVPES